MDWYGVLKAVRKLTGNDPERDFTAEELALGAGLKGTERSSPRHIASAWLGKMVRWGYVVRSGAATTGTSRRSYRITRWGIRKAKPKRKFTAEGS